MKPYCGDEQARSAASCTRLIPRRRAGGDWAKLRRSSDIDFCPFLAWSTLLLSTLPTLLTGGRAANSMSALLETSLGDIVIDLLVDESPKACEK